MPLPYDWLTLIILFMIGAIVVFINGYRSKKRSLMVVGFIMVTCNYIIALVPVIYLPSLPYFLSVSLLTLYELFYGLF